MKTYFYILLSFFVAAFFTVACLSIDAQTVRQIDPVRLKPIVYPPLTEREGKDLTLPVPPPEHPRLYFRKSDLPALKMNAQHPLLKECWEKVQQSASMKTDGELDRNPGYGLGAANIRIINAIEAKAFMYALTGDKNLGNEALDLIFNLHNKSVIDLQKMDISYELGRIIWTTAVVYDWCYDLMSSGEKKSLIAVMESLAVDMEITWPSLVLGSVSGHGCGPQLLRDMLACAIATYDENPEIYRRTAGRIFAEIIPALNFVYRSEAHHQGSSYGSGRYQCAFFTTTLFGRMGYRDVADKLQGTVPYRYVYTRRPDGSLFRDGDDWIERRGYGYYWPFFDLSYVASYYRDPLLMGEAIRQGNIGQEPLYDLILVDPSVPVDNHLDMLPLTKYFPYPFGAMTARTSWENGSSSETAVVDMKIIERHFGNHQHLDAGSFQIYYKGPLATETGIYQGTESLYGGSHFVNYYQRTIAHNCMLVYNPDEKFTRYGEFVSNDGGQLVRHEPHTLEVAMSNECLNGEVKAHYFGPDVMKPEYSYLKGDITRSYSNKVKDHQRSFVFLNLNNAQVPATLIVYDYLVSSSKDFKKTWLMHCVQEPAFKGNVCTVVCNDEKKAYNGKLVNTVLLPSPQNIVWAKVGGIGNEYSVGGINYPNPSLYPNNSIDGADWRIELSPKTPSETDVFLNVMQVTDAGNAKLLPVEKIETDRMTGVQIGDRIVLFAKNGNPENSPINLTIKGTGVFKVLITDLEKGNWTITGSKVPGMVKNDHNHVYFQATAGTYIIAKK